MTPVNQDLTSALISRVTHELEKSSGHDADFEVWDESLQEARHVDGDTSKVGGIRPPVDTSRVVIPSAFLRFVQVVHHVVTAANEVVVTEHDTTNGRQAECQFDSRTETVNSQYAVRTQNVGEDIAALEKVPRAEALSISMAAKQTETYQADNRAKVRSTPVVDPLREQGGRVDSAADSVGAQVQDCKLAQARQAQKEARTHSIGCKQS